MALIITTPMVYRPICRLNQHDDFLDKVATDPYLFASFYVLTKPYTIQTELQSPNAKSIAEYLSSKQDIPVSFSMLKQDESLKTLSELKRQLGDRVTALYTTDFMDGFNFFNQLKIFERGLYASHILDFMEEVADAEAGHRAHNPDIAGSAFHENIATLATLLELDDHDLNLLRLSFLYSIEPSFTIFYRYLELSLGERADILKDIAELLVDHPDALNQQKSKLLKFGICSFNERNQRFVALSEWWVQTLSANGFDEFQACFISELEHKSAYKGVLARTSAEDATLISELFRKKEANIGCNVLFYGSSSMNLRGAVIDVIEQAKIENVFELNPAIKPADMPGAVAVAQAMLTVDDCLLVEKAENALTRGARRDSYFHDIFGDALPPKKDPVELTSDEFLLGRNACFTLWIASSIDSIDTAAVGRFLMHVEVKPASRDDRKAAIAKLADKLDLSEHAKQTLSTYVEIGLEQLESAAKLVRITGADETKLLATVAASQKALGRDGTEELRESVTKYDLSLLNLQSRFKPERVIEALKKSNSGTLCFYGMPGTGKTQLAEYIALQLNKPLLIKRASDIFSMWLGESEKNIKKIFDEAKAEGAVLLLDEADSFLRDRAMARAAHEVSTVNELLTRMERYSGVFICATNLFESLDAAALRRFTFKFQFQALDDTQRLRMFKNETGIEVTDDHPLYFDLMKLRYLTPGDFATVKRQAMLFDETLTPEVWLEQLDIESKAKLVGLTRQNLISGHDLSKEVTVKERV